jgi:glycerophosphoryl diester phosphodiesterase
VKSFGNSWQISIGNLESYSISWNGNFSPSIDYFYFKSISRALNNKSMFAHLQRRGIPVYVWILNNDQEFQYAFQKLGVTGIMTDYPTLLQKYLESNKEHPFML